EADARPLLGFVLVGRSQKAGPDVVALTIPAVSSNAAVLLVTVALLTIYVVGVGGTTATAIRIRERFRQQKIADSEVTPRTDRELFLSAPALPAGVDWLRRVGWLAFGPALVFAVFVVRDYPWVTPVAVVLMVAINAFYFTAMQN